MVDMMKKSFTGSALTIGFRIPDRDQWPVGYRKETRLVLEDPERASVADEVDVIAWLPGREAPRFVPTWEDFARRKPPGRSLSGEKAGGPVGQSAFTVRRFMRARRLPARHGRWEGFGWGREALLDRRGRPEVVHGEPASSDGGSRMAGTS
jgi:hypothetical protein